MNMTVDDLLRIIGALYVKNELLRRELAALRGRMTELERERETILAHRQPAGGAADHQRPNSI